MPSSKRKLKSPSKKNTQIVAAAVGAGARAVGAAVLRGGKAVATPIKNTVTARRAAMREANAIRLQKFAETTLGEKVVKIGIGEKGLKNALKFKPKEKTDGDIINSQTKQKNDGKIGYLVGAGGLVAPYAMEYVFSNKDEPNQELLNSLELNQQELLNKNELTNKKLKNLPYKIAGGTLAALAAYETGKQLYKYYTKKKASQRKTKSRSPSRSRTRRSRSPSRSRTRRSISPSRINNNG